MPFVPAADATIHELHGTRFVSYVAPATGSRELCAWRTEVPGGVTPTPHRISREEVFLVLSGVLDLTIDGETRRMTAGDAAVAPPGSSLRLANPSDPSDQPTRIWVCTGIGLRATLDDGSVVAPPWAN